MYRLQKAGFHTRNFGRLAQSQVHLKPPGSEFLFQDLYVTRLYITTEEAWASTNSLAGVAHSY